MGLVHEEPVRKTGGAPEAIDRLRQRRNVRVLIARAHEREIDNDRDLLAKKTAQLLGLGKTVSAEERLAGIGPAHDQDVAVHARKGGGRPIVERADGKCPACRSDSDVAAEQRPAEQLGDARSGRQVEDEISVILERRNCVGHSDADLARLQQGVVVLGIPDTDRAVT